MPVALGTTQTATVPRFLFDRYPGIWRQGDWIRFSERGSCVVTGRSDATLNRGGVRLGTGEFYAVMEELPEIVDALVVHLEGRRWRARGSCPCPWSRRADIVDDALRSRIAATTSQRAFATARAGRDRRGSRERRTLTGARSSRRRSSGS